MEITRPSEEYSLPGHGRGRELSGHGQKQTERGALTAWRQQREDLSGHKKKSTKRGELTSWRRQREGLVRTQKETNRARGTHFLETAERGTCQDTKRNGSIEEHSHPGDGRGTCQDMETNRPSKGALTH